MMDRWGVPPCPFVHWGVSLRDGVLVCLRCHTPIRPDLRTSAKGGNEPTGLPHYHEDLVSGFVQKIVGFYCPTCETTVCHGCYCGHDVPGIVAASFWRTRAAPNQTNKAGGEK